MFLYQTEFLGTFLCLRSDKSIYHLTPLISMGVVKNGPTPPLFCLFRSFQTNNTIFTTNICEKTSIQFMAPGFEPTTSQT